MLVRRLVVDESVEYEVEWMGGGCVGVLSRLRKIGFGGEVGWGGHRGCCDTFQPTYLDTRAGGMRRAGPRRLEEGECAGWEVMNVPGGVM